MKFFGAVFFLGAFLVFIKMPDGILADVQLGPHEVYESCHDRCNGESCIGRYDIVGCNGKFPCNSGYVCESGYIREFPNGRCILPTECPPDRHTRTRFFTYIPQPHEVYNSCVESPLIDTCDGEYRLTSDFARLYTWCWSGYVCEPGYIRISSKGRCILPSECPPRG